MATNGKVKTLYEDREQTQALFPRTKTNAVSDSEGYSLDAIISALQDELDNKAPDGYGLGKSATWIDNLDNAKRCGFYNWTENAQGAPLKYGSMIVIDRTAPQGSRIIQLAFEPKMETNGALLIRYLVNSDWSPWEWINPPMHPDVEYRTTERYGGKIVYALHFNTGALPNADSITYSLPSNPTDIVDLYGTVISSTSKTRTPFPCIDFSTGTVQAMLRKTASSSIVVRTFADLSSYTASITVKYTKD